ncbi:hypothetical protein FB451DRAFT_1057338, partial [Mycena latifolia]
LNLPVPKVLLWCSRAENTEVGAEWRGPRAKNFTCHGLSPVDGDGPWFSSRLYPCRRTWALEFSLG